MRGGWRAVHGLTFPVVVSADVEGVQQLVVVVGQQVQTSGPGLDNVHHLRVI